MKLSGMPIPNIINLKECSDRREYIIREFKKYGVTTSTVHLYERFENSNVKFIGNASCINETPKGVTSSHLLTIKYWLETTDEDWGIFFEDDADLSTTAHWNFTLEEFIERLGTRWECLHLCGIWEDHVAMIPRKREVYDFGLQAYAMKRSYAEKLVKFYFTEEDPHTINFRMPHGYPTSTENNVLGSFGVTYTFPLFNHNVYDFGSKNHHTTTGEQLPTALFAYKDIKKFWEQEGWFLTLEEIFNPARVAHTNIRYEYIHYEQK